MTEPLCLLPGWGLGLEPLRSLCQEPSAPLARARLIALPELSSSQPEDWLDALDRVVPADAWLLGWSLGGMLALQLAARRGSGCPGVMTIAANACFLAHEDWPQAMAADTLRQFEASLAIEAGVTLKRFALLCSQGSPQARTLGRWLFETRTAQPLASLQAGLALLAQLDNRPALNAFAGPQLHILGGQDALVPVAAAAGLRQCLEGQLGEVVVLPEMAHAWSPAQVPLLHGLIESFLARFG